MRTAALLAILLVSPLASASPFSVGMGLGAGSGPARTGWFLSDMLIAGYSVLPWLDARALLVGDDNKLSNLFGEGPELRANAGLLGVQVHPTLVGPLALVADAAAGLGRVSEPLSGWFGGDSQRRTDLAWQLGIGASLEFPASRRVRIAIEWVIVQYAHYPHPDRLTSVEGKLQGLMVWWVVVL